MTRALTAWFLSWADAAEMRSPRDEGYLAGVVDGWAAE